MLAATLVGCTITTKIDPIPAEGIRSVCIRENQEVWSKEFLPALVKQLEQRAIATKVIADGTSASDCRHYLEYVANWSWDLVVYLVYADIRIYDEHQLIGRATYDARGGYERLDKFGRTETKLAEIMAQLLRQP